MRKIVATGEIDLEHGRTVFCGNELPCRLHVLPEIDDEVKVATRQEGVAHA